MAFDFLQLSRKYRGSKPIILKRRSTVIKHLNNKYEAGRNRDKEVFEAVRKELQSEGIETTISTYNADKLVIRNAYVFLISPKEKQEEMLKRLKSMPGARGVSCLLKDGIRTWEDVENILRPSEPKILEQEPQPEAKGRPEISELQFHLEAITRIMETLLKEHEESTQENKNLRSSNQSLEEQISSLNARISETRKMLERAHAERLETLLEHYPELRDVKEFTQKLNPPKDELPTVPESKLEELRNSLPDKAPFKNRVGKIYYEKSFLQTLFNLPTQDAERVEKCVRLVVEHKENHPSLRTKKPYSGIPHTPPKSFMSRATDEIRFTWTKSSENFIFYYIYRRGDVPQSER